MVRLSSVLSLLVLLLGVIAVRLVTADSETQSTPQPQHKEENSEPDLQPPPAEPPAPVDDGGDAVDDGNAGPGSTRPVDGDQEPVRDGDLTEEEAEQKRKEAAAVARRHRRQRTRGGSGARAMSAPISG